MPRQPRINPIGIPQHVIQRGNNRQPCFCEPQDFGIYARFLKNAAEKHQVKIHAWCFMTNHVHLLATPDIENGVSFMMQSLGRRYVQYFNKKYKRTGTLWEGRFKSCLIDTETYLFICYRYIELNPVRAKMVRHPLEYQWSSYRVNAGIKPSKLITFHELYEALGRNAKERAEAYTKLFNQQITSIQINAIQSATAKGIVVGSYEFKTRIEQMIGRSLSEKQVGRPPSRN